MKKVLLLGDSIRMGYDDYVKEELDGKCEVVYDAASLRTRCGRRTRCSSITVILTWYTGTTATGT